MTANIIKKRIISKKTTIILTLVVAFSGLCVLIFSEKIRNVFAFEASVYEIRTAEDFSREGTDLINTVVTEEGLGARVDLSNLKNTAISLSDTPTGNIWIPLTDPIYDKNGNIFVIASSSESGIWKYDTSNKSWAEMANLPAKSLGGSMVYDGDNYIYATQGFCVDFNDAPCYGVHNGFWRYDILENTWSSMTSTPTASAYGSMVYDGGNYIYAIQGNYIINSTWYIGDAFWRYDIANNIWSTISSTPFPSYDGAMVHDNSGNIFILPGMEVVGNMGYFVNKFWKYNVAGDSWTTLENTPFDIGNNVGGSLAYDDISNSFYTNQDSNFWKYDMSSNVWSELVSLDFSVGTPSQLVYGDKSIFFINSDGNGLYEIPIVDKLAQPASWESDQLNLSWNEEWVVGNSFFAEVSTPPGTAIEFEIKTAILKEELSYAEYSSLGIASGSGASFEADLEVLGIEPKKFAQIKAIFSTDDITDGNKNPELKNISMEYMKDVTPPENNVSEILLTQNNNGKIISNNGFGNDRGWGGNYTISWQNGSDSESGVTGYCLNVSNVPYASGEASDPAVTGGLLRDSVSDPGDGSYGWAYFTGWFGPFLDGLIDISTDTGWLGCHMIVKDSGEGGTSFNFVDSWDRYGFNDGFYLGPNYVNIKAIDNAGNVSSEAVSFLFSVDEESPNMMKYVLAPSGFVTSFDETVSISWPMQGTDEGANDLRNGVVGSGIAGYFYKITEDENGDGGTWYGLKHTGDENTDELIPADATSYVLQKQFLDDQGNPMLDEDGNVLSDFAGMRQGLNYVFLKVCDIVGNCNENSSIKAVIKVNTTAPSAPRELTVSTEISTVNSYSFSWKIPETYPGKAIGENGSKLDYCYTVNALPSAQSCAYTSRDVCVFDENGANGICTLPQDAFATQPGENTFFVAARYKTESGQNINYDDYASVKFSYSGSAPGIPMGFDVADISSKANSDWKTILSWSSPENIGAGISFYKIFRSESGGTCSENIQNFEESGSSSSTSFIDTELAQKEYYYCARACDSANNCGAVSTTVSMLPTGKFIEPAELVTGPEVKNISTSKATIVWTTKRDSDSKIAYGKEGDDFFEEEPSNFEQVVSHEISLNHLLPGKTYHYKAKWTDEDGNIGISEDKTFKTEPAPIIKDVVAKDISISSATIKFTAKGGEKAKIYYGTSPSFGGSKELSIGDTEGEYDFRLTGLIDNTKYYYRINTFDAEDSEYEGTTIDFTTLPKPRISNVEIEAIKDSAQPGIRVTWNTNTEISSIISYAPINNPTDNRVEVQVDLVSGSHEETIMNLRPMTTYQLTVKGIDRVGNEATSDTYSFTTASDTRPPQISEIVVEGASTKNQADKLSQFAVAWNTDEASTSQVEFGEGVGTSYTQKTQEDSNLTNNHLVIISGLTPSKVYHLRIISKDQMGNLATSHDTVSITPKAVDSAFELVVGNLVETFGFLKGLQN
ncbi:MAG: cytochrome c family protein [uncultured bacterium]|nr:MAG: cytochrome c family protein [uncultured bacterium]